MICFLPQQVSLNLLLLLQVKLIQSPAKTVQSLDHQTLAYDPKAHERNLCKIIEIEFDSISNDNSLVVNTWCHLKFEFANTHGSGV